MPKVHFSSLSFLAQLGINSPPQNADQIRSRLRRDSGFFESELESKSNELVAADRDGEKGMSCESSASSSGGENGTASAAGSGENISSVCIRTDGSPPKSAENMADAADGPQAESCTQSVFGAPIAEIVKMRQKRKAVSEEEATTSTASTSLADGVSNGISPKSANDVINGGEPIFDLPIAEMVKTRQKRKVASKEPAAAASLDYFQNSTLLPKNANNVIDDPNHGSGREGTFDLPIAEVVKMRQKKKTAIEDSTSLPGRPGTRGSIDELKSKPANTIQMNETLESPSTALTLSPGTRMKLRDGELECTPKESCNDGEKEDLATAGAAAESSASSKINSSTEGNKMDAQVRPDAPRTEILEMQQEGKVSPGEKLASPPTTVTNMNLRKRKAPSLDGNFIWDNPKNANDVPADHTLPERSMIRRCLQCRLKHRRCQITPPNTVCDRCKSLGLVCRFDPPILTKKATSPPLSKSSSLKGPRKSKRCVRCRKSHVRCVITPPSKACDRCKAYGLPCIFDPPTQDEKAESHLPAESIAEPLRSAKLEPDLPLQCKLIHDPPITTNLASFRTDGVRQRRSSGRWLVEFPYEGKRRYFGTFDKREQAELASRIAQDILRTEKGSLKTKMESAKEAVLAAVHRNSKTARTTRSVAVSSNHRSAVAKVSTSLQVPREKTSIDGMNTVLSESTDAELDYSVGSPSLTEKMTPDDSTAVGVKQLPSGNWQVAIEYRGKERCFGTFDNRDHAVLANKVAREKLTTAEGSTKIKIKLAKEAVLEAVHQNSINTCVASEVTTNATAEPGCTEDPEIEVPAGVAKLPSGNWQVRIGFQKRLHYFGTFEDLDHAVLANEVAREKFRTEKGSVSKVGELAKKAVLEAINNSDSIARASLLKQTNPETGCSVAKSAKDPKLSSTDKTYGITTECPEEEASTPEEKTPPKNMYLSSSGRWRVEVGCHGKKLCCGTHDTQEQALQARNIAREMLKAINDKAELTPEKVSEITKHAKERTWGELSDQGNSLTEKSSSGNVLCSELLAKESAREQNRIEKKNENKKLSTGTQNSKGNDNVASNTELSPKRGYQNKSEYVLGSLPEPSFCKDTVYSPNTIASTNKRPDSGDSSTTKVCKACDKRLAVAKCVEITPNATCERCASSSGIVCRLKAPMKKKSSSSARHKDIRQSCSGKWRVDTKYQGTKRYFGSFETRGQAELAYDIILKELTSTKDTKLTMAKISENISLAKEAALRAVSEEGHGILTGKPSENAPMGIKELRGTRDLEPTQKKIRQSVRAISEGENDAFAKKHSNDTPQAVGEPQDEHVLKTTTEKISQNMSLVKKDAPGAISEGGLGTQAERSYENILLDIEILRCEGEPDCNRRNIVPGCCQPRKGFGMWFTDRKIEWRRHRRKKIKLDENPIGGLLLSSPCPAEDEEVENKGSSAHENSGEIQWEYAVNSIGSPAFETLWRQRNSSDTLRHYQFFNGGKHIRNHKDIQLSSIRAALESKSGGKHCQGLLLKEVPSTQEVATKCPTLIHELSHPTTDKMMDAPKMPKVFPLNSARDAPKSAKGGSSLHGTLSKRVPSKKAVAAKCPTSINELPHSTTGRIEDSQRASAKQAPPIDGRDKVVKMIHACKMPNAIPQSSTQASSKRVPSTQAAAIKNQTSSSEPPHSATGGIEGGPRASAGHTPATDGGDKGVKTMDAPKMPKVLSLSSARGASESASGGNCIHRPLSKRVVSAQVVAAKCPTSSNETPDSTTDRIEDHPRASARQGDKVVKLIDAPKMPKVNPLRGIGAMPDSSPGGNNRQGSLSKGAPSKRTSSSEPPHSTTGRIEGSPRVSAGHTPLTDGGDKEVKMMDAPKMPKVFSLSSSRGAPESALGGNSSHGPLSKRVVSAQVVAAKCPTSSNETPDSTTGRIEDHPRASARQGDKVIKLIDAPKMPKVNPLRGIVAKPDSTPGGNSRQGSLLNGAPSKRTSSNEPPHSTIGRIEGSPLASAGPTPATNGGDKGVKMMDAPKMPKVIPLSSARGAPESALGGNSSHGPLSKRVVSTQAVAAICPASSNETSESTTGRIEDRSWASARQGDKVVKLIDAPKMPKVNPLRGIAAKPDSAPGGNSRQGSLSKGAPSKRTSSCEPPHSTTGRIEGSPRASAGHTPLTDGGDKGVKMMDAPKMPKVFLLNSARGAPESALGGNSSHGPLSKRLVLAQAIAAICPASSNETPDLTTGRIEDCSRASARYAPLSDVGDKVVKPVDVPKMPKVNPLRAIRATPDSAQGGNSRQGSLSKGTPSKQVVVAKCPTSNNEAPHSKTGRIEGPSRLSAGHTPLTGGDKVVKITDVPKMPKVTPSSTALAVSDSSSGRNSSHGPLSKRVLSTQTVEKKCPVSNKKKHPTATQRRKAHPWASIGDSSPTNETDELVKMRDSPKMPQVHVVKKQVSRPLLPVLKVNRRTKWQCDFCHIARFDEYEEALQHELICKERPKEGVNRNPKEENINKSGAIKKAKISSPKKDGVLAKNKAPYQQMQNVIHAVAAPTAAHLKMNHRSEPSPSKSQCIRCGVADACTLELCLACQGLQEALQTGKAVDATVGPERCDGSSSNSSAQSKDEKEDEPDKIIAAHELPLVNGMSSESQKTSQLNSEKKSDTYTPPSLARAEHSEPESIAEKIDSDRTKPRLSMSMKYTINAAVLKELKSSQNKQGKTPTSKNVALVKQQLSDSSKSQAIQPRPGSTDEPCTSTSELNFAKESNIFSSSSSASKHQSEAETTAEKIDYDISKPRLSPSNHQGDTYNSKSLAPVKQHSLTPNHSNNHPSHSIQSGQSQAINQPQAATQWHYQWNQFAANHLSKAQQSGWATGPGAEAVNVSADEKHLAQKPSHDCRHQQLADVKARAHSIPAKASWYYYDLRGAVQGPFATIQMRQWHEFGHLKNDLLIGQAYVGPFRPLSSYFPDPSKAFMHIKESLVTLTPEFNVEGIDDVVVNKPQALPPIDQPGKSTLASTLDPATNVDKESPFETAVSSALENAGALNQNYHADIPRKDDLLNIEILRYEDSVDEEGPNLIPGQWQQEQGFDEWLTDRKRKWRKSCQKLPQAEFTAIPLVAAGDDPPIGKNTQNVMFLRHALLDIEILGCEAGDCSGPKLQPSRQQTKKGFGTWLGDKKRKWSFHHIRKSSPSSDAQSPCRTDETVASPCDSVADSVYEHPSFKRRGKSSVKTSPDKGAMEGPTKGALLENGSLRCEEAHCNEHKAQPDQQQPKIVFDAQIIDREVKQSHQQQNEPTPSEIDTNSLCDRGLEPAFDYPQKRLRPGRDEREESSDLTWRAIEQDIPSMKEATPKAGNPTDISLDDAILSIEIMRREESVIVGSNLQKSRLQPKNGFDAWLVDRKKKWSCNKQMGSSLSLNKIIDTAKTTLSSQSIEDLKRNEGDDITCAEISLEDAALDMEIRWCEDAYCNGTMLKPSSLQPKEGFNEWLIDRKRKWSHWHHENEPTLLQSSTLPNTTDKNEKQRSILPNTIDKNEKLATPEPSLPNVLTKHSEAGKSSSLILVDCNQENLLAETTSSKSPSEDWSYIGKSLEDAILSVEILRCETADCDGPKLQQGYQQQKQGFDAWLTYRRMKWSYQHTKKTTLSFHKTFLNKIHESEKVSGSQFRLSNLGPAMTTGNLQALPESMEKDISLDKVLAKMLLKFRNCSPNYEFAADYASVKREILRYDGAHCGGAEPKLDWSHPEKPSAFPSASARPSTNVGYTLKPGCDSLAERSSKSSLPKLLPGNCQTKEEFESWLEHRKRNWRNTCAKDKPSHKHNRVRKAKKHNNYIIEEKLKRYLLRS